MVISEQISPFGDMKILRERCWNLRIERLCQGWCVKFTNNCIFRKCTSILGVRHTYMDKNKRHVAYGKYYCMEQLVKERDIPFASSEIQAMKDYLGIWK